MFQVDSEVNTLLMRLPNLLDSRVPDGDGEEDNHVVADWGQEYLKSGEVRLQLGFYALLVARVCRVALPELVGKVPRCLPSNQRSMLQLFQSTPVTGLVHKI